MNTAASHTTLKAKKKLNRIFIGEELSYMILKVLYFMPLLFLVFFFFAVVGKVINQIIFSIMKEVCTKLKLKRKGFYLEFTHEIILRSKLGCEMLANVCCLFFFFWQNVWKLNVNWELNFWKKKFLCISSCSKKFRWNWTFSRSS